MLVLQFTAEKNETDTHVVIIQWAFSDAGSTPAASTKTFPLFSTKYKHKKRKGLMGCCKFVRI